MDYLRPNKDQEPLSQKILVVDDDPQVRDLLGEVLRHFGHEVESAVDGVDALQKVENDTFNIVITDLNMPRMDGMELISEIHNRFNNVDTIAITGYDMKYKYTDVINLGASDFITKPFNLNELEAKLNRLIRERTLRMELERLCIHDCLTSLYNRRHLDYQLKFEAVRALRQHHNLYLIFIDVDNFKQYNDTKGHHAGDSVLEKIGRVLKKSIRENVDSAFRYGGDEFVVLIPYATERQALMVAERIQKNFYNLGLEIVSLSIGVAKLKNDPANPEKCMNELLKNADKAAYKAKNEFGGNKVVVYKPGDFNDETSDN